MGFCGCLRSKERKKLRRLVQFQVSIIFFVAFFWFCGFWRGCQEQHRPSTKHQGPSWGAPGSFLGPPKSQFGAIFWNFLWSSRDRLESFWLQIRAFWAQLECFKDRWKPGLCASTPRRNGKISTHMEGGFPAGVLSLFLLLPKIVFFSGKNQTEFLGFWGCVRSKERKKLHRLVKF